MSETSNKPEWPDLSQFQRNRAKMSPEMLRPYVGQYVAWSLDGTRIVAGAADEAELIAKLRREGIDLSQVVLDHVPDPNVSWL